jgi:uncharacterized damage-inducible protein DinB
MPISQMLLPEFDQEMANTRKLLERVPEDKWSFQPHQKSMTLGRLAGHVATLPRLAGVMMRESSFDADPSRRPPMPATKTEAIETFDKLVAEDRALISQASDEQMTQVWKFSLQGKEMFKGPRIAMLRSMFMNHLIHHRAQLGVYLRLNEVPIPGMYGPSADEM